MDSLRFVLKNIKYFWVVGSDHLPVGEVFSLSFNNKNKHTHTNLTGGLCSEELRNWENHITAIRSRTDCCICSLHQSGGIISFLTQHIFPSSVHYSAKTNPQGKNTAAGNVNNCAPHPGKSTVYCSPMKRVKGGWAHFHSDSMTATTAHNNPNKEGKRTLFADLRKQ